MIAEDLRAVVWRANLELLDSGLVMGTFGNVSGADHAAGLFVIKPSGVPYEDLTPEPVVLPPREPERGYVRPPMDEQTFVPDRFQGA